MATIITGIICFIVGGWFGVGIMAVLAAGRDIRDQEPVLQRKDED